MGSRKGGKEWNYGKSSILFNYIKTAYDKVQPGIVYFPAGVE